MENMIKIVVISLFFFGCETGGQFDQYHLDCPSEDAVEIDVSTMPIIEVYKDGVMVSDFQPNDLTTDTIEQTLTIACASEERGPFAYDFTVYYPN